MALLIDAGLLIGNLRTISDRVWVFDRLYPWIRVLGTLAGAAIGWLCSDKRQDRWAQFAGVFTAGILTYHLFW